MTEVALITVSCVLFIQMGLSDAVQRTLHISLRIVSCPKCLTWWICLGYLVTHDYGIIVSVATSFICSYAALWLALAYDVLATLYNHAYTQITRDTAETPEAGIPVKDGTAPGSDAVSEMQMNDESI